MHCLGSMLVSGTRTVAFSHPISGLILLNLVHLLLLLALSLHTRFLFLFLNLLEVSFSAHLDEIGFSGLEV